MILIDKISLNKWISLGKKISKNYKKYGSYLPEQKLLLERIHHAIFKNNKPVSIFVSPTGTGKTHVICLAAQLFQDISHSVAIVTPSNYLKQEFIHAKNEVVGKLNKVDFLNLSEYSSSNKVYDYVLIDETQNLKSFIELDNKTVKNVAIKSQTDLYDDLIDQLPPTTHFIAKQISFTIAKQLLDNLKKVSGIKNQIKEVLKDPTSWKTFVYVGRDYPVNYIRFMRSSPNTLFKKAKKQLLLFSATNLSDAELSFYCGINKNDFLRIAPVERVTKINKDQRQYIGLKDQLSEENKIEFVKSLIQQTKIRTLVLFSNSYSCDKFYNKMKRDSRIFCISNEFDHRRSIFEKFLEKEDRVLFTASTIFWEGITINDLKLLIIVDIPYPHPNLLDLVVGTNSYGNRMVIRRLEQGAGRIGRKKKEHGVGVFLFKFPSKLESWLTSFKKNENYSEEHSWNFISDLKKAI